MKFAVPTLITAVLSLCLSGHASAQSNRGQVFQYADKALALAQIRWAGENCAGIEIDPVQLRLYREEEPAMPVGAPSEIEGYIWGASQTWEQVIFLSNPEFWCGRIQLMGELEPGENSTLAILYESARALNKVLVFDSQPAQ